MNGFFGQGDQLTRFLLMTCGLLTLAGTVACLMLGNALLAVACCIVSAWSLGTYQDTVYAGLMSRPTSQQPSDELDADE